MAQFYYVRTSERCPTTTGRRKPFWVRFGIYLWSLGLSWVPQQKCLLLLRRPPTHTKAISWPFPLVLQGLLRRGGSLPVWGPFLRISPLESGYDAILFFLFYFRLLQPACLTMRVLFYDVEVHRVFCSGAIPTLTVFPWNVWCQILLERLVLPFYDCS